MTCKVICSAAGDGVFSSVVKKKRSHASQSALTGSMLQPLFVHRHSPSNMHADRYDVNDEVTTTVPVHHHIGHVVVHFVHMLTM